MKNIKLYLEDGNELELETCFLTIFLSAGLNLNSCSVFKKDDRAKGIVFSTVNRTFPSCELVCWNRVL